MSTIAEIRALAKPLIARYPDLFLHGRHLILPPIDHVAKGLLFEGVSGKHAFVPNIFFAPTFFTPHVWSNFGRPYVSRTKQRWMANRFDVAEELMSLMEEKVVPTWRSINTLADFRDYANDPAIVGGREIDKYFERRVILNAAFGAIEEAAAELEIFDARKIPYNAPYHYAEWQIHMDALRAPLAARDRAGVGAALRAIEEANIRALKLEKWWRPTPFPVEEGA